MGSEISLSCKFVHRMLSRELSDLLMERDGVDFAADAVGDDVFHWQLTFERFTPACPLATVRMSSASMLAHAGTPHMIKFWQGQHAVSVLVYDILFTPHMLLRR